MKIYKCKKCGKKISRYSGLYGSGLCMVCCRKGKKLSKVTREKMSQTHIERYKDPKERQKHANKGENNGMFAKKYTKSTLNKMSKAQKNRYKEHEEHKKHSLACGGSGTPYENLDLVLSIRHLSKYNSWRTNIFKRDKFTCQECGQKNGNGKNVHLEAHHIKSFAKIFKEFLHLYSNYSPIEDKEILLNLAINYKDFWNLDNGKTLCQDCHKLTDNYGNLKKEMIEI